MIGQFQRQGAESLLLAQQLQQFTAGQGGKETVGQTQTDAALELAGLPGLMGDTALVAGRRIANGVGENIVLFAGISGVFSPCSVCGLSGCGESRYEQSAGVIWRWKPERVCEC